MLLILPVDLITLRLRVKLFSKLSIKDVNYALLFESNIIVKLFDICFMIFL